MTVYRRLPMHFFDVDISRFLLVFRSKYCTYKSDIKMARGSRHATGAKNTVSKYDQSNIFQILRKPSPGCHIFFSGRVDQLAPTCTRIPLSSSCRRALRGIRMQKTSRLAKHRKANSECKQRAPMSINLKTRKMHFSHVNTKSVPPSVSIEILHLQS